MCCGEAIKLYDEKKVLTVGIPKCVCPDSYIESRDCNVLDMYKDSLSDMYPKSHERLVY
jgi:hypothetical protein